METTITISTIFNAPAEKIWPRLVQVETLRKIAKPYAYFKPLDNMSEWNQNDIYRLKLNVFGIIPFGVHQIRVLTLDKAAWLIETHEANRTVKVWNHRISLEQLPDSNTRYTDTVTLNAGKLTAFIRLWSIMFYRHRQRKWKGLLK